MCLEAISSISLDSFSSSTSINFIPPLKSDAQTPWSVSSPITPPNWDTTLAVSSFRAPVAPLSNILAVLFCNPALVTNVDSEINFYPIPISFIWVSCSLVFTVALSSFSSFLGLFLIVISVVTLLSTYSPALNFLLKWNIILIDTPSDITDIRTGAPAIITIIITPTLMIVNFPS